MHALIRFVSADLHSFQIAFFRNLFGLVVLLPFFVRHGGAVLSTARFGEHFVRSLLQTGAMLSFFLALSMTPLVKASALSFTAPLFAGVGAVVLLGEHLRLRRVIALIVGFGGALLIVRPGVIPIDRGAILVLVSSALWALAMLLIKRMTATESSATLTAWMCLLMTPMTLLPALAVWRWPDARHWLLLLALGVVGASSQYVMAEGFRLADASTVLPADFTRLIWASVLGWVLFGEIPSGWTYAGASLILGATAFLAYRESRRQPPARVAEQGSS
ncbi:MAG: DMT family transporter [Acidobacteria bacterium]|nr:MAG: DMT family transporter [Acidobacteriota bacterium]REK06922.1 MAG: DMT family transporter [Acidobacteriota bacterium]